MRAYTTRDRRKVSHSGDSTLKCVSNSDVGELETGFSMKSSAIQVTAVIRLQNMLNSTLHPACHFILKNCEVTKLACFVDVDETESMELLSAGQTHQCLELNL